MKNAVKINFVKEICFVMKIIIYMDNNNNQLIFKTLSQALNKKLKDKNYMKIKACFQKLIKMILLKFKIA